MCWKTNSHQTFKYSNTLHGQTELGEQKGAEFQLIFKESLKPSNVHGLQPNRQDKTNHVNVLNRKLKKKKS